MANRNPTNRELADKLDQVILKQDKFQEKIEERMQTFNDFMVVQKALQTRKADGSVDWQKLIERALVIMSLAAGTVYMVIEFLIKGANR